MGFFFWKHDGFASASIYENSLRPSDAYMHKWSKSSSVQIMICHLFGAKILPELNCLSISWTLRNIRQWNFNSNSSIFIEGNVFENVVYNMASILWRPQSVKLSGLGCAMLNHVKFCRISRHLQLILRSNFRLTLLKWPWWMEVFNLWHNSFYLFKFCC